MIGWAAGALFVIVCGAAAAYAAVLRSPHEGEHVRFIQSEVHPWMQIWYCTRCGEHGTVDHDARNSGGFIHSTGCHPPQ